MNARSRIRLLCAVTVVLAAARGVFACSDDGPTRGDDDDDGIGVGGAGGTTDGGGMGGGGNVGGAGGAAQEECVTDVPCASDLQCVSIAGTACNRALDPPRCQTIQCGAPGSPCSAGMFCAPETTPCLFSEPDIGTCGFSLSTCMEICTQVDVVAGGGSDYHFCTPDEVDVVCNRVCAAFPGGKWAEHCDSLEEIRFDYARCDPYSEEADVVSVRCDGESFQYGGW